MALCSSMCLDYAGSAADVTDELAHRRARPCRGSDRCPHLARPVTRTQPRLGFCERTLRRQPCASGRSPSGPPKRYPHPARVRGSGFPRGQSRRDGAEKDRPGGRWNAAREISGLAKRRES
jgi:hypothetical protein